jgi:hypothetical protein
MVIDFERSIGMFTEQSVQQAALHVHGVVLLLNRYYAYVHFPATVAFIVWVFLRRRAIYASVRNWFAAVTMIGLAIHVAFPLAPPRFTPGFVDTLRVYGPHVYHGDAAKSVANQFAAMPSLHFGWALIVGLGLCTYGGRLAVLWLAHPMMTLLAIVATGNHYWIDAGVAAVLVIGLAPVAVRGATAELMPRSARSRWALAGVQRRHLTGGGDLLTVPSSSRRVPWRQAEAGVQDPPLGDGRRLRHVQRAAEVNRQVTGLGRQRHVGQSRAGRIEKRRPHQRSVRSGDDAQLARAGSSAGDGDPDGQGAAVVAVPAQAAVLVPRDVGDAALHADRLEQALDPVRAWSDAAHVTQPG